MTGDRLRPAAEAMTVRVRRGEALVTHGPLTEASEVVAGFGILECGSMQEAVDIASGHAMAHAGASRSGRCGPSTKSRERPPVSVRHEPSLEAAVRAQWSIIVAGLLRTTGDWDLAEDCAQDATWTCRAAPAAG